MKNALFMIRFTVSKLFLKSALYYKNSLLHLVKIILPGVLGYTETLHSGKSFELILHEQSVMVLYFIFCFCYLFFELIISLMAIPVEGKAAHTMIYIKRCMWIFDLLVNVFAYYKVFYKDSVFDLGFWIGLCLLILLLLSFKWLLEVVFDFAKPRLSKNPK